MLILTQCIIGKILNSISPALKFNITIRISPDTNLHAMTQKVKHSSNSTYFNVQNKMSNKVDDIITEILKR